jgi:hypothetical protein
MLMVSTTGIERTGGHHDTTAADSLHAVPSRPVLSLDIFSMTCFGLQISARDSVMIDR